MMDSKTRRAITQKVGARVELDGEVGTVVGHYDDDIVFVTFDGHKELTRVWVTALTLVDNCDHLSSTGVDTYFGPGKVMACDECGRREVINW